MATTLTAEPTDFLAEIEDTEVTDAQQAAVTKVAESIPYTATMLTAMSIHLSDLGDPDGAQILLECAMRMAKHEAATI